MCFFTAHIQEGQSTNNWEKVSFGDEEGGGATQLKFRRLMGIGESRSYDDSYVYPVFNVLQIQYSSDAT